VSRFELYEDDGRTNDYRRGHHALTPLECATGPEGVTVSIGAADGDRSVIPAGRRYLLRVRLDQAPRAVAVTGRGEVPRLASADQAGAGWWADGGFVSIRLPAQPAPITVTLRT
jgi:hypothetical protein